MSSVETRQVDRDSLLLIADVRVDGGETRNRVKVRNLSAGGMMAEGEFKVARGALVIVDLRNIGEVEGSIAWIEGNRLGIAFLEEIDPKLARAPLGTKADGLSSPRFTRTALGKADPRKLRSI